MAQHTLEPAPTRAEMFNLARLVLEAKKARGYRTNVDVARAIGLQEAEMSRLLNARVERHWGFSRLSKVASWLAVSLDAVLGRPEGTTKLMLPGGVKPRAVPIMRADRVIMTRDDVMETAKALATERERFRIAVRGLVKDHAAQDGIEDALLDLADGYVERVTDLRNRLSP